MALENNGASEHYLDDRRILLGRFPAHVYVWKNLGRSPQPRVPQAEQSHQAYMNGMTMEQARASRPVRMLVVLLPGIGRHLFQAPSATAQGATTTFALT